MPIKWISLHKIIYRATLLWRARFWIVSWRRTPNGSPIRVRYGRLVWVQMLVNFLLLSVQRGFMISCCIGPRSSGTQRYSTCVIRWLACLVIIKPCGWVIKPRVLFVCFFMNILPWSPLKCIIKHVNVEIKYYRNLQLSPLRPTGVASRKWIRNPRGSHLEIYTSYSMF